MRRAPWFITALTMPLFALAIAACGGSSKPNSTQATTKSTGTASQQTSSTRATPPATSGASARSSSITTGPVRATLRGANHAPVAGKNWVYTVTATDAAGHPLSGTVLTEFAFAGQVEGRETPPIHPLKHGRLHDVIQYPADSVGVPLTLQAVVRTKAGNVTLGWPIRVTK